MTTLDLAAALAADPPRLPNAILAMPIGALAVVVMVVIGRLADPKNRSREDG